MPISSFIRETKRKLPRPRAICLFCHVSFVLQTKSNVRQPSPEGKIDHNLAATQINNELSRTMDCVSGERGLMDSDFAQFTTTRGKPLRGVKTKALMKRKLHAKTAAKRRDAKAKLMKSGAKENLGQRQEFSHVAQQMRTTQEKRTPIAKPVFDPFEFTDSDMESKLELEKVKHSKNEIENIKHQELAEDDIPLARLLNHEMETAKSKFGDIKYEIQKGKKKTDCVKKSGSAEEKPESAIIKTKTESSHKVRHRKTKKENTEVDRILNGCVGNQYENSLTSKKQTKAPRKMTANKSLKNESQLDNLEKNNQTSEFTQGKNRSLSLSKTVKRKYVRKAPNKGRVKNFFGEDAVRISVPAEDTAAVSNTEIANAGDVEQSSKSKQKNRKRVQNGSLEDGSPKQKKQKVTEFGKATTPESGTKLELESSAKKRQKKNDGNSSLRKKRKQKNLQRKINKTKEKEKLPKKPVLSSKDMLDILEDVKNESKLKKRKKGRRPSVGAKTGAKNTVKEKSAGKADRNLDKFNENKQLPHKKKKECLEPQREVFTSSIDAVIERVARGLPDILKKVKPPPNGGRTTVEAAKTPPKKQLKLHVQGRRKSLADKKKAAARRMSLRKPVAKRKITIKLTRNSKGTPKAKGKRVTRASNKAVKESPIARKQKLAVHVAVDNQEQDYFTCTQVRRNPKIKTTDEVKKHLKEATPKKNVTNNDKDLKDAKLKLSLSPKSDDRLAKLIASVAKSLHVEVRISY